MKNSTVFIFILLSLFLILTGCKDYTEVVPVIRGTPGGGVTQSKVVNIQGNEITFEVNLFCVNHVGNFIENLETDVFAVNPVLGVDINVISSDYVQQEYQGKYSVGLLFDQSGSIGSTDPNNARVDAGKAFVDLMGKKDEMALARFSGVGNSNQYDLLSSFTHEKSDLKSLIGELADNQFGGTPLYESMDEMIQYVGDEAKNQTNKAVVAFTDGVANGIGTPSSVIAQAHADEVKVFTIGLNLDNYNTLQNIALETGGAVMQADDALQLISLYQSLGELLEGTAYFYNTTWKATKTNGQPWVAGNTLDTKIQVSLPTGETINLPLFIRVN